MSSEILRLVDSIHRDKDIDKEIVFEALESAVLSAVQKKLGGEEDAYRAVIDRATGEIRAFKGDSPIEAEDLGRLAALSGKQVLIQRIREAERDKIYSDYEEKLGKLVTGVVQRMEGPNMIINLAKVEGIMPRSEQAPGEKFRVGDRIKVIVKDVKKNANRVKVTLSRTSPQLVRALFELEVPEIAEKVIEIMDIVREPGYRTKIAVTTYDHNVDCVGACVGVRGARIKNIVDELFGEKIDIVRWNESIEVLIMNALKPAEIASMDLDYEAQKALVYVRADQQSLAIGKRGQNVRLASRLARWDLDIVTVSDAQLESLRRGDIDQGDHGEPLMPPEGLAPVASGEGALPSEAEAEGALPSEDGAEGALPSEDGAEGAAQDPEDGALAAEAALPSEGEDGAQDGAEVTQEQDDAEPDAVAAPSDEAPAVQEEHEQK